MSPLVFSQTNLRLILFKTNHITEHYLIQSALRDIEESYIRRYWELWEQNKKLKNVLSVSVFQFEGWWGW